MLFIKRVLEDIQKTTLLESISTQQLSKIPPSKTTRLREKNNFINATQEEETVLDDLKVSMQVRIEVFLTAVIHLHKMGIKRYMLGIVFHGIIIILII